MSTSVRGLFKLEAPPGAAWMTIEWILALIVAGNVWLLVVPTGMFGYWDEGSTKGVDWFGGVLDCLRVVSLE